MLQIPRALNSCSSGMNGNRVSHDSLRYPDFMCIGAQKAGTTWLDKNLRQHPHIWLPPVKEIHYFDSLYVRGSDGNPKSLDSRRTAKVLKKISERMSRRLPFDKEFEGMDDETIDVADRRYGKIFGQAPRMSVCGEVTPRYALLPEVAIEHILRLQPNIKFIFIMRDPIERAWSGLRMEQERAARNKILRKNLGQGSGSAIDFARGNYPTTIERFGLHVRPERFLNLFFDDLVERPADSLCKVCEFLGVEFRKGIFENASTAVNQGPQRPISPTVYAELREQLEPVYRRLLALNIPIAERWYRKHYT